MNTSVQPQRTPPAVERWLPEVRITRPFHAWLHYHVLSHLDLGPDGGSIYDPRRPPRRWVRPLMHALAEGSHRRRAQLLPLDVPDEEAMYRAAGPDPLAERLRSAWCAEYDRVADDWQADDSYAQRLECFFGEVADDLTACRASLGDAPPLVLADVPALGRHGRAVTVDGAQVVAVSLGEAPGHVFCEVLYQEALARRGRPAAALDGEAVAEVEAVVGRVKPKLGAALPAWRRRLMS